ncbi:MAG: hypothetical protein ACLVL7_11470 [Anaerotruncus massiliensis (ex Togo et al. 2019)]
MKLLAEASGKPRAGLWLKSGSASLKNCVIADTTGAQYAGGIAIGGGTVTAENLTLSGNTVTGGSAQRNLPERHAAPARSDLLRRRPVRLPAEGKSHQRGRGASGFRGDPGGHGPRGRGLRPRP